MEARESDSVASFVSYAVVNIRLVDINDNSPQFIGGPFRLTLSESINQFPYPVTKFTVSIIIFNLNFVVSLMKNMMAPFIK